MNIKGQLNGVNVERVQFTARDREYFPECDNKEYLEYERVSTGLSTDICSYGYRQVIKGKSKWIRRSDLPAAKEAAHTSCVWCKNVTDGWTCDTCKSYSNWTDWYTPAPAPAPKHSSCLGCEDENTEPVPHCCVHCSSAKTGDVEHYNWHTAPAPKVTDEPRLGIYLYLNDIRKVCLNLGMSDSESPINFIRALAGKASALGMLHDACREVGMRQEENGIAFIRSLAQRERGYACGVWDACKLLEADVMTDEQVTLGEQWSQNYPQWKADTIRKELIKVVTKRKGG